MKVYELYDMFYNMNLDTWVRLVRTKTDREVTLASRSYRYLSDAEKARREVTLASRPYRYLSDTEKAQTVLDFGIKRGTEEVYIHVQ